MTPEERSLLERTHELAQDNNRLLQTLNRRARMGVIVKVVYWTIIIGLSLGAFYFIQPYVEFLRSSFGGSHTTTNSNTASTSYVQQLEELWK